MSEQAKKVKEELVPESMNTGAPIPGKTDEALEKHDENPQTSGKVEDVDMEEDFSDFFESDAEDLKSEDIVQEYQGDLNLYAPSVDHEKAVNKEYNATGRFLKNPRANKNNSLTNIVSKYVSWIPNPNNLDSRIMVDDAGAWGDRNNILTKAFFALRGHDSLAFQNMASLFSRKLYHFAPYQIIKDAQEPELNGKIKIFRFAKQVDELIDGALKSDPENGISSKLYSDPIKGHRFILKINQKQVDRKGSDDKMTITNYDKSMFADAATPLTFDEVEGEWWKDKDGMRGMFNYLNAETPVLEDYMPKKWDTDTENDIIESIKKTIGNPALFDKIYFSAYGKSYFSANNNKGESAAMPDADAIPDAEEDVAELKTAKTDNAKKGAIQDVDYEDISAVSLD